MTNNKILSGFSKLTKDEKIEMVAGRFGNTGEITRAVTLQGLLASKGAQAAIEAAGGKVE